MGPYPMDSGTRSRIRRLAAAARITPEAMVADLIAAGLEALDPGSVISDSPGVDLTSGLDAVLRQGRGAADAGHVATVAPNQPSTLAGVHDPFQAVPAVRTAPLQPPG
jgi:hypothetical protein